MSKTVQTLVRPSFDSLMSSLKIIVHESLLDTHDLDHADYKQLLAEFFVRLKLGLVEQLCDAYDLRYKDVMTIVRAKQFSDGMYEFGVDSPDTYPKRYQKIVRLILQRDIGSITHKIIGTNIIGAYCNAVSSMASLLWADFVRSKEVR